MWLPESSDFPESLWEMHMTFYRSNFESDQPHDKAGTDTLGTRPRRLSQVQGHWCCFSPHTIQPPANPLKSHLRDFFQKTLTTSWKYPFPVCTLHWGSLDGASKLTFTSISTLWFCCEKYHIAMWWPVPSLSLTPSWEVLADTNCFITDLEGLMDHRCVGQRLPCTGAF